MKTLKLNTEIKVNSKKEIWAIAKNPAFADDLCFIFDKGVFDITIPFFTLIYLPHFMEFYYPLINSSPELFYQFHKELNKPINSGHKSYFRNLLQR